MASNSYYNGPPPQGQPGGYPPPPEMQQSYSGNGQMQYHDPNAYGPGGEKGYQGQQPSYDYSQQQGPPVPHQQMMPNGGYPSQPPYNGQPGYGQQGDRGVGTAAAGAAGGAGCCACCATCLACCACCEVLDCIF